MVCLSYCESIRLIPCLFNSFILFDLRRIIQLLYNNAGKIYSKGIYTIINMFSLVLQKGVKKIVQFSIDTLFRLCMIVFLFPPIPALSSAEHIFLLSPPRNYLHEDLHLNGCGKCINNTSTNKAKHAHTPHSHSHIIIRKTHTLCLAFAADRHKCGVYM